jgi:hypothetical protein
MEEYEVFDEYLQKSKIIRAFCEDRERMLFESIRIDTSSDGKIIYLKAVGKEIDEAGEFIEEMKKKRKSSFI